MYSRLVHNKTGITMTIKDYFQQLGGYAAVAKELGARELTANSWQRRNVIAREYVPAFIRLAKKRGVDVNIDFLITGVSHEGA